MLDDVESSELMSSKGTVEEEEEEEEKKAIVINVTSKWNREGVCDVRDERVKFDL